MTANDQITVDVVPGRIHCLLGENGAGKSTLMNILFGLLQPDEGEITLGDQQLALTNPKQAMAAGIGMVHQHFMLIPVFTVAENMVLGHEPSRAGILDLESARRKVRELSERYKLDVDPTRSSRTSPSASSSGSRSSRRSHTTPTTSSSTSPPPSSPAGDRRADARDEVPA
nr:ATP-binding cassette domain-containing protein [Tessaracoccus coleopterorum]